MTYSFEVLGKDNKCSFFWSATYQSHQAMLFSMCMLDLNINVSFEAFRDY